MSLFELEQTPFLVFCNILLYGILFVYTRPALIGKSFSGIKNRIIVLLLFVFCLFSFWGADWFGYLNYFLTIKTSGTEHVHMEEFYLWIAEEISDSYLVFRTIVWGTSLLALLCIIKITRIRFDLALFFFATIYLMYFSYARVTLAIVLMCLGYLLLYVEKKRIFNIILGIALLWASFYLHKSAILGIVSIIAASVFGKMGKKSGKFVLVAFPIMVFLMMLFFQDYFSEIQNQEEWTLSQYANSSVIYLEKKSQFSGIGTFIQQVVLERIPYYILAFACYREINHPSQAHPSAIKAFMVLLLLNVVFASVFLFDFGVNTDTIYIRYLRFAQIPALIVLTYMYDNNIQVKLVRVAYKTGILCCIYSLAYVFYNTCV